MSILAIQKVDEGNRQALRIRAAKNKASMKAEGQATLEEAVREPQRVERAKAIRRVRGQWKGRTTTDDVLVITRSD